MKKDLITREGNIDLSRYMGEDVSITKIMGIPPVLFIIGIIIVYKILKGELK